jgi:hypothetical protein
VAERSEAAAAAGAAGQRCILKKDGDDRANLLGKMAALSGPIFAILVLLVVILGLQVANISTNTAMQADIQNTLNANEPCFNCAQANMDVRTIITNLMTGTQSGWYANGGGRLQASVAVGNSTDGGRVLAALDYTLQILNQQTGELLATINTQDWLPGSYGESQVQYDPLSNRFFYVAPAYENCYEGVIVEPFSPDEGVKCSARSNFGSQNYDLEGYVVVADPVDGCTALNNAGAVNGNIGIVQLSSNCPVTVAVKNVQNAGGIAALIVDDTYEFVVPPTGVDGTIFIPSQLISLIDGQELVALLTNTSDVVVAMNSSAPSTFLQGLYIVPSTSSTPNSADDFYVYLYTNPNWTGSVFLDRPKSVALPTALLVATEAYVPDDFYEGDTMFLAFNLQALITGTGPQLLWTETPLGESANGNFMQMAQITAPLNSGAPLVFIVNLGAMTTTSTCPGQTTTLAVRWADATGLYNPDTPQLLTMPPLCFNQNQGTRQPPPLIPFGFGYTAGIKTAMVTNYTLVFAVPNAVSSVHVTTRWGEVDLSTFASNGLLSFTNVADVNPTPTLDFTSPCITRDADGNTLLMFTSNGPQHYMSVTYTGRLRQDPHNMMRYPLQNWAQGNATFFNTNHHGQGWNYQGCALSAVDRKTTYMYGAYADPNGPFDVEGRALSWTAALGTVQINKVGFCPPGSPNLPRLTPVYPKFEAQYAIDNPWNRSASIEAAGARTWSCTYCPTAA